MATKGGSTVETVSALAQPVADEMGLVLWDVRFEKEGSAWYLRLFIDKADGSLNIDDCENFSRAMDKILDEADPIEQSYYLEVSSPGIDRELRRRWQREQYLHEKVQVRTIRPVDGRRDFLGELLRVQDDGVTLLLEDGSEQVFSNKELAVVKLYYDFGAGE